MGSALLGIAAMFCEWSSLWPEFFSIFFIILAVIGNLIEHSKNISQKMSFKSMLLGGLIGLGYALCAQTTEGLLKIQPYPEAILYTGQSFGLVLALYWWALLLRSEKNNYDLLVCYSYWPKSFLARMISVISYYASSNGLFILTLCLIWLPFFDLLEAQNLDQLPTHMILMGIAVPIIVNSYISQMKYSVALKPYAFILLLAYWLWNGLFLYYISHFTHHIQSLSIINYKSDIYHWIPNVESNQLMAHVSVHALWATYAGLMLARYVNRSPETILGMIIGVILWNTSISHYLSWTLSWSLTLMIVILGAIRTKHPVHAIDSPWGQSQRTPLRLYRWLMPMGHCPWMIFIMDYLCGRPIFILMMNQFTILLMLGIMIHFLQSCSARL